ncbi:antitoxin VapB [Roseivivax halotolerans]|uniref:Antitoxin VapB n=1 Tax=Roseivivax halotolerans TaxID=93684 RepID=A0A1I6AN86_9RHOB|nr:type II toxin-antitoxin system VapB family antitoxin [Roseivivax halotolerans]SFQ70109.1 antitoxin VapB [Roseivivax halotolerans]
MPGLFIRDEAVNALAVEAMKLTGAENKTEAVRAALNAAIATAKDQVPLLERLEVARNLADRVGPVDPDYDAKADADAMWGDV